MGSLPVSQNKKENYFHHKQKSARLDTGDKPNSHEPANQ